MSGRAQWLGGFVAVLLVACVQLEKPLSVAECSTRGSCSDKVADGDPPKSTGGGQHWSTGGRGGAMTGGGGVDAMHAAGGQAGYAGLSSGGVEPAGMGGDVCGGGGMAEGGSSGARASGGIEAGGAVSSGGRGGEGGEAGTGGSEPSTDPITPPPAAKLPGTACTRQSKDATCSGRDICYKFCGPESQGTKSLSCTSRKYIESDCSFSKATNYACYALKHVSACDETPTAATKCKLPTCKPCGSPSETAYYDSTGAAKPGYCVCTPEKTWSCASPGAWPCPDGNGC